MEDTVYLHAKDVDGAGLMKGVDARGNLQIESLLQISAGTPVTICCQGDFCAIGEAMYCHAAGSAFLIGLRIRSDRRSEPRSQTSVPAIIEELQGLDTRAQIAEILHISLSGAGLTTRRGFNPGAIVRIETDSWFRFAEVRHSTPAETESHFVGIVFLTGAFVRTPQRSG